MAGTRPIVLITETEYGKGEACFLAAPGLECRPAPDPEDELAAAVRDTQSRYVIVGGRRYGGAPSDPLPPTGLNARSGVGHARKPPVWMKQGDTIEIEIEGIGVLANPIRDESPAA